MYLSCVIFSTTVSSVALQDGDPSDGFPSQDSGLGKSPGDPHTTCVVSSEHLAMGLPTGRGVVDTFPRRVLPILVPLPLGRARLGP